jgi:hypothetical protein
MAVFVSARSGSPCRSQLQPAVGLLQLGGVDLEPLGQAEQREVGLVQDVHGIPAAKKRRRPSAASSFARRFAEPAALRP